MMETIKQPEDFLRKLLKSLELVSDIHVLSEKGILHINITGNDAPLLLGLGGEVLYSLEHLLNKIFTRSSEDFRIICDANSFRIVRDSELRAMAQFAADQVRKTSQPFVFASMSSNERRVIHEFLANELDVKTESIDIANERRLKVVLQR
jgi:spoIIIJ-associated protein